MTRCMRIVLLASVASAAGSTSCTTEQPKFGCVVAKPTFGGGGFAALYTPKTPADAAAPCGNLKGEVIGLFAYHPVTTNADGTKSDANLTQLAIRTSTLGALEGKDLADSVTSLGDFPKEPGPDGFCEAPTLSTAEQHIAADGTNPAVDISYTWSDVRVLSVPDAPGTQLTASLKYTDGTCTANYDVVGVWPNVSCAVTDETGAPAPDPQGGLMIDPTMCAPADPEHGRFVGSGINPSFPITCNKDMGLCVLDGQPPAFK